MLFSDNHIGIMNSNLCVLCVMSLCALWFLTLFNHKVHKKWVLHIAISFTLFFLNTEKHMRFLTMLKLVGQHA